MNLWVAGLIGYSIVMTILWVLTCSEFKLQAMLKRHYWQTLQDVYKLLDEAKRTHRNVMDTLQGTTGLLGAEARGHSDALWHLQKVTAKLTTVAAEKRDLQELAENTADALQKLGVKYANMSDNYSNLYAAYGRAQKRLAEAGNLADSWKYGNPEMAHKLFDVLKDRES